MESSVRQPDLQPVEPRVELPGEELGRLWVELLVKRPPYGLTQLYVTWSVPIREIGPRRQIIP